jgi:hypothetical protein
MSDGARSLAAGGLFWFDLHRLLDTDRLWRLLPHLTHTGLDGQPCVEQDRLDDLIGLLDGGAE